MNQNARFGDNRTGVCADPGLARDMTEGMEAFPPTSVGDETDLAAEMALYVEASEGLGSVPPLPQQALPDADEDEAALFVDKLGERLAFERSGVRLYDGLIAKLEAHGEMPQGPTREDLERLRGEELEHFHALEESMLALCGDPTAVTPSADAAGVIASGVAQVLGDPRAGMLASLEAILVAELADNEGWDTLIELARGVGLEDVAERFEGFAEQEREHLTLVRMWIAMAQGRTAPSEPH
jgi:rubrerythrin